MRCPWCRTVRNQHEVNLPLTAGQAKRLRMLLIGETEREMIEARHRRTWWEILARLERAVNAINRT